MANAANLWWKALISVAYNSGLRKNEILNLIWADVNFENNKISIAVKENTKQTIEWEPKDHESRIVLMAEQTARLLANLQAEAKESFPYIFISPARLAWIKQRQIIGKWNPESEIINNLWDNFHITRCRAGVAKCTLHDLCRSAITNWAQLLPIQVVQQLAGHSDISTTREYCLIVRREDLEYANKVLDSILAKGQDDWHFFDTFR